MGTVRDPFRPFILELTLTELATLMSACSVSAEDLTATLKVLQGSYDSVSLCGDVRANRERLRQLNKRLDAMLMERHAELKEREAEAMKNGGL